MIRADYMLKIFEFRGMIEMKRKMALGLNRDVIKYIAMFTMFLNHFANVLLPVNSMAAEIMMNIGYFTAPVMCYFLVEGYQYTHSKQKYGQRLLLFAFLSEIPFVWATGFFALNMLFTLFFCFLLLCIQEKETNPIKRMTGTILLFLATLFSDWALLAPMFTLLFWKYRADRKGVCRTFVLVGGVFGLMNLLNYLALYPFAEALLHSLFSVVGVAAAGIVITCFYNGKRAERGRVFSKWFFYLFYPLHLLVLCAVRAIL